jgi:hypothetical protein
MNKILCPVSFVVLMMLIFGCGKETYKSGEEKNTDKTTAPKSTTAIVGSIISIDSTKHSTDKNTPCSKAPCWAEVKIEKITGIGQGGPLLDEGDTVTVKFTFTLSETTEDLIPNLDKRMPGLSIEDKFEADIRTLPGTSSGKLYTVYFYSKL